MFTLKEQRRIAPPELIQYAKNEVQDIINNVRGIDFIMLCSTDGFELTTITK